jgi:hypothetical protein
MVNNGGRRGDLEIDRLGEGLIHKRDRNMMMWVTMLKGYHSLERKDWDEERMWTYTMVPIKVEQSKNHLDIYLLGFDLFPKIFWAY